MRELLQPQAQYKKLYIIRSVVPSRDIGFLPGKVADKASVYEAPYYAICSELFGRDDAYEILKRKGLVEFVTTSFVRGTTFRDCIIMFDEFQNTTMHEFSSVVTRVGENCRLLISGDYYQTDLLKTAEKKDVLTILEVLRRIPMCSMVDFKVEDIVRSEFVKQFIIARNSVTGE
jgi:phosphate starvation-inducible PhoH-like protein